ncbi:MAG: hypothetical protein E7488_00200 [Ruminococcaceae bacterium]|nr:hypothetical protein [Oscillospiraceae bacterium]
MKKKIFIILPILAIAIVYLIFGFGRAGDEIGFKAKILVIDDNIVFAETIEDDAGFLSHHLPKKFYFELDMIPETASNLFEGDIIHGTYVDIKGNVAKVVEVRLSEENERLWDKRPAVMVDGVLYYDTNTETPNIPSCGLMDGEITSTVESWQLPEKNDQSNFGTGYSYQYGTEKTVVLYINGKRILFKAEG